MADRNRNQWDDRWQHNNDRSDQYDRSRDDYSSNYENTQGMRYGGEDYRSDAPNRSNNSFNRRNERRDDYSDLDRDRGRSTNMGSGYDAYNYGQTVGSFNQGKEGSYTSRNDRKGFAPSYDRMFDNESGYDSDYNRSYGRRSSNDNYGSGSYYGNNYRDRADKRNDWNNSDWQRDRGGYSHSSKNRDWWDRATDEVASWFGDDDAERRRDLDKRTGPHRGKGPKGYSRSDERIKDDVNDRLSDDSFVDASEIEVTCEGSEIVLTGTVDTKEEKRRAEDIAERVSGVKNVENRLKVRSKESSGGSTIYRDRD